MCFDGIYPTLNYGFKLPFNTLAQHKLKQEHDWEVTELMCHTVGILLASLSQHIKNALS